MPGLDGLAAAKEISRPRSARPCSFSPRSRQRDLIEQARDAGALAYLVKPFQKEELLPAIEVALGRHAGDAGARGRERHRCRTTSGGSRTSSRPRRWIDRAKGRLMDDHQLREAEAFCLHPAECDEPAHDDARGRPPDR